MSNDSTSHSSTRRTSSRKRKATVDEPKNNRVPTKNSKKQTAHHHPSNKTTPPKFLLILSPAKTMDTSTSGMTSIDRQGWTLPDRRYASKTNALMAAMKQHSPTKLSKLLGISTNLALTAAQYWKDIEFLPERDNSDSNNNATSTTTNQRSTGSHAKPAIYTFQGAAYQGLDIHSLVSKKNPPPGATDDDENDDDDAIATILEYLQDHLRIIDPLYGSLRPFDVMRPYRLEMATRNVLPNVSKLQDYWRDVVMTTITADSGSSTTTIVNVASDEYASVLSDYEPQIKVVFQHGGKVIAMHAKRARGLFVRYCAQHQVKSLEELQGFDFEGYVYQPKASSTTRLVFDRPANYKPSKTKKTK